MSMINPVLLPNPANLFLRKYFYRTKTQDRQIDNDKASMAKTIYSIIESKPKDRIIQESDIEIFMKNCKDMASVLHGKNDFKETTKLDLELYQMCLLKIDQSGLSNKDKDGIHYLLDSLKDYTSNIIKISERKKELVNISKQLDYADFEKSLYECILTFICAMLVILRSPLIKIETNVLSFLIKEGFNFASDLDSYTDTLDILTNPDELNLLERSESNMI